MNKLWILNITFLLTFSCSSMKERSKARRLQSSIIRAINGKTTELSKCVQKHKIYQQFELKRLRVELKLKLNHKGQVETFQLDSRPYPEKFIDCLFNIVDLMVFPALDDGEAISLTQPIIFIQK